MKTPIAKEAETALIKKSQTGDKLAREALVAAYAPFLISRARRWGGCGVEKEDLLQEGAIGLIRAIDQFDPRFGVRLASYASWKVDANMRAFAMRASSVVDPSKSKAMRTLFSSMRSEASRMSRELGRDATRSEIAARLGVKEGDVGSMEALFSRDFSLSSAPGGGTNVLHRNMLGGSKESPVLGRIRDRQVREAITKKASSLTYMEHNVLQRMFLTDAPATQVEIARAFGVTRQRVHEVVKHLLGKLSGILKDFNETRGEA